MVISRLPFPLPETLSTQRAPRLPGDLCAARAARGHDVLGCCTVSDIERVRRRGNAHLAGTPERLGFWTFAVLWGLPTSTNPRPTVTKVPIRRLTDPLGPGSLGTVLAAYQQPVGDAIWITLTLVFGAVGSLALYRDVGGVNSRLANDVAARNRRVPFRYLRFDSDPESVLRLQRGMALATFVLCAALLGLEAVAVAVNGLR